MFLDRPQIIFYSKSFNSFSKINKACWKTNERMRSRFVKHSGRSGIEEADELIDASRPYLKPHSQGWFHTWASVCRQIYLSGSDIWLVVSYALLLTTDINHFANLFIRTFCVVHFIKDFTIWMKYIKNFNVCFRWNIKQISL